MIRFGMHSSLWTGAWTREGAELSVSEAARYGLNVIEIALLEPEKVDVAHSLELLKRHNIAPTASLGLPLAVEATQHPDEAQAFLFKARSDPANSDSAVKLNGSPISIWFAIAM